MKNANTNDEDVVTSKSKKKAGKSVSKLSGKTFDPEGRAGSKRAVKTSTFMDKEEAARLETLNENEDVENTTLIVNADLKQLWKKLGSLCDKDTPPQQAGRTNIESLGANNAKKLLETFIGHAKAEVCQSDNEDTMDTDGSSNSDEGKGVKSVTRTMITGFREASRRHEQPDSRAGGQGQRQLLSSEPFCFRLYGKLFGGSCNLYDAHYYYYYLDPYRWWL